MRLLFKRLRPFAAGFLLAVALLFGQAMCDLNLPSYMSDIVNVGIQQSGITNAAPQALSENSMLLLCAMLNQEEQLLLRGSYTLTPVTQQDAKGKPYSESYPKAQTSLYIKHALEQEQSEQLDKTVGVAAWTFLNLMREMAEQAGGQMPADLTKMQEGFDIHALYAMLPQLAAVPPQLLTEAHDAAAGNDPMLLKQSGIQLAKAFYTELGRDTAKMQSAYVLRTGLLMLLIALGGGIATVLVSLLSSRIAAGFARNLRRDMFERIESFSNHEFDQFSTASLITRCTNDVTQIQMLLTFGIRMVCYAPIMGIGGIIMAVNKSASMSWIIAVAVCALLGLIAITVSIAMPKFKIIQNLIDRLNLVSRETLSGLLIIRAFSTQKFEQERFDKANQDLTKVNRFVTRVMAMMMPMMMLIMNGVSLLIVWVAAHQIADARLQIGDMMAFIQYAMQIIMSFAMISMIFIFLPRAMVSLKRIGEVLDTEPSIRDPEQVEEMDAAQTGSVVFDHVCFRYDGASEDALHDISFAAKPGQTTAIIGSTGSGKSTIANLILRFYDVTGGCVRVNGADVRKLRQSELRSKIGYVPQKGVLLSGTIASNIRYGNAQLNEAETLRVAEIAQASGFIAEKEDGLDSEIAQGGTNVSGGQRQRLSIARALAVQPDILVFDDSFSALDFKTDAALRKRLKETTAQSTVIVIAQRVSTIMQAEQILVLNEGKLVGRGTHQELLHSCPEYYEIAATQLAKEELA